ncbi:hypothetical protein [Photobacterium leiognathi]|uniref:hypothetical protein n=1 Tax=Photobacterium leiognathi TaxID=553611 RepID=UPI0029821310|nr:hypothetical protein [Photobacterium leiognathi]
MNRNSLQLFSLLGVTITLVLHIVELATNLKQSLALTNLMFEWLPLYLVWGAMLAISYQQWLPQKRKKPPLGIS